MCGPYRACEPAKHVHTLTRRTPTRRARSPAARGNADPVRPWITGGVLALVTVRQTGSSCLCSETISVIFLLGDIDGNGLNLSL